MIHLEFEPKKVLDSNPSWIPICQLIINGLTLCHSDLNLALEVNYIVNNLEREYRDCIKSRRDKVGITRHITMIS